VKKSRRDVNITLEQADAHQRKHGFRPLIEKQESAIPGFNTDGTKRSQKKLRVGVRKKTQVEREFEVMLSVKKMNKQIEDFRFEGVRLPWGDGMLFKADFAVLKHCWNDKRITLIEVKGDHIWKHAIVRFKGCRAEWKQWFDFEFHQRTKDGKWHQLL
jgi:hypothetical protein